MSCMQNYSRAYIRHLLKGKGNAWSAIIVLHNLYFYNTMMEEIGKLSKQVLSLNIKRTSWHVWKPVWMNDFRRFNSCRELELFCFMW